MLKENERIIESIIWLIACVIHGVKPDISRLENINVEDLYKNAKRNSILSLIYISLEETGYLQEASAEIFKKWKEHKEQVLVKNILFDEERRIILQALEQTGIYYIPLKGIKLQNLYPKYGTREMADNDILFDISRKEDLRKIFLARGYKEIDSEISAHLSYEKAPFYNFEMHKVLFKPSHIKEMETICHRYEDVKKYLVKDEDNQYGYHFSPEEDYLYVLAHMYKHFIYGGTGIRSLIDLYVMHEKYNSTWDWDYILKELQAMGLENFEKDCSQLCCKLFGTSDYLRIEDLSDSEKEFLGYFFESGTYGTIKNKTYKDLRVYQNGSDTIDRTAKLKYLFRRIFPELEWCKYTFPMVYRHPWIYPFFVIWRIIRGILTKSKIILEEFKIVFKK